MENKEKVNNLRHSAAHLLAAAIMQLYPGTKRTIGPAIENGFYFDFDFPEGAHISEKDFPKIEQKMHELVKDWHGFEKHELSKEDALKEYPGNEFKAELIEEFSKNDEKLSFYKSGNYWDLCKGGHIDSPKENLKYFKLLKLAGAYWRGSEKNKMLTRIYGTAFFTQKELDDYLHMQEEAEKRDHKKLGPQLDLFFSDETSPGMHYWLPKGLTIYNQLLQFSEDVHAAHGYLQVVTPQLNKKELYMTSGHWSHYRDDMFLTPMSFLRGDSKEPLEGSEVLGVKPMNCPNAMTIFRAKTRSYKDLPLRLFETSFLHRFELSGTLNGLFRTREFRQDDAHIFLPLEKVGDEFGNIMQLIELFYNAFDLPYVLRFGTRSEKFMGDAKDWDIAEKKLQEVLDQSGKEYFVAPGEGAFYGPKVDILMKDSLGRQWQTGTVQLDFQQPKNFGLVYVDAEGKQIQPVVLHRAIFGSFERFLGILIEHFAGSFPTWLAPVQIALLPIADRHIPYAQEVAKTLEKSGFRVEVDGSPERLQAKIRTHTLQRVPFMGIIGDKEINEQSLSVRKRTGEDLGTISLDQLIALLKGEVEKKIV